MAARRDVKNQLVWVRFAQLDDGICSRMGLLIQMQIDVFPPMQSRNYIYHGLLSLLW